MLAQVVYGEARGEIYTGQVAVAAVVLNRLEDADFPNTLYGVVFQKMRSPVSTTANIIYSQTAPPMKQH